MSVLFCNLLFLGFQLASGKPPVCGCSCSSLFCLFRSSTSLNSPPQWKENGDQHGCEVLCSFSDVVVEIRDEGVDIEAKCLDGNLKVKLKSILKNGGARGARNEDRINKKRVGWMDFQGKELVQVKEFEASDLDDSADDDEKNRCLCVIQ